MNRETTFHSSDTLIVTDRSARRRWVIIGAVVILALLALGIALMMGRGSKYVGLGGRRQGRGPDPDRDRGRSRHQPGRPG